MELGAQRAPGQRKPPWAFRGVSQKFRAYGLGFMEKAFMGFLRSLGLRVTWEFPRMRGNFKGL